MVALQKKYEAGWKIRGLSDVLKMKKLFEKSLDTNK